MVKRLINKLRKGVILATAWLLFGGCQSPYEPQPPKAIVYANPNSGDAPLESRITLDGEDPDGNITEYKVEIDDGADGTIEETITQDTPIDITRTFSDGNVKVYGQCTDSTGLKSRKEVYITLSPTATPTAEPTPVPYRTVSGRLQDNETDTNQAGEVRLYIDDVLNQTDSDGGNFSFSVPYNSNVKLKGVIKDGSTQKSYIRTKNLGNVTEDTDIDLRAVPYPDFDTNNDSVIDATDYANFRAHMNENATFSKWNLGTFDRIKIFKHNGSEGDFSDGQVTLILSKITDDNDIEKFVNGYQFTEGVNIQVVDGSPTQSYEDNCIYVVPDGYPGGNGGAAGWTGIKKYSNRTIYSARIEYAPECVLPSNPVISHEFGHVFVAPDGHSNLADELTLMNQYNFTEDTIPLPADIKSGKVVNESTYNSGERLDDIFGASW